MRSTFSRVVPIGPSIKVRCRVHRLLQKRVRVLIGVLVLSLLIASLPVSAGTTRRVPRTPQEIATPISIHDRVTHAFAAIGGWLARLIPAERPRDSYQPVTAYYTSPPPFIDAPIDLTVTATSGSTVDLSWTPPTGGAHHYDIERSNNISAPFLFIGTTTGTTYQDTTVSNLHAYLYRVRSVTVGGLPSTPSNMAFGTAISFEFSSLTNQPIKAQDFYDVRTATNAVRALTTTLGPQSWSPRDNLLGQEVKATDVQVIRDALDVALGALSVPLTAYQDSTLLTGTNGTFIKAIHIEQLQTRSTRGKSTSSGPIDPDSSSARLDPMNETGGSGENPLSRNFNLNLPMVQLRGRTGLDLNLRLAYNSLVWTKIGSNSISFDDDNGFPGPGFRLGFPVIQPPYHNAEVGKDAYLLIGSDGSRTELRQVGTSPLYESGDSSHLLLDTSTMILRTTDGTQMAYEAQSGEYKCKQIKDRNGNYITVTYDQGRLNTITDTLGRVINFAYQDGLLMAITQQWNPSPAAPHYWARFEYTDITIDTNFPNKTVYGPPDGSKVKMLTRVRLADDSYLDFSYTSWGQVFKISAYAPDTHLLNYSFYNLPQTAGQGLEHDDCPRFTQRYDWVQYWNGDTEGTPTSNEEALTQFAIPTTASWTMPGGTSPVNGMRAQVTTPDGTSTKTYFLGEFGWQRSLPALLDTYTSGGTVPVRRVMSTWTQDATNVSYLLNPRLTETNIYDDANNRARTEITYQQFDFSNGTSCHLPEVVKEYAADASTVLRSMKTVFNMAQVYTDLHIFGLISEQLLYEGEVNIGPLRSKVASFYDESGSLLGNDAPLQHDNTNFSASFLARGNLSSMKRYDVTNTNVFTTVSSKYNTAGSLVSSTDAETHTATISYNDSFSDGTPRGTFAYPTTITDQNGNSTTSIYNFNFGSLTRRQTPQPDLITYEAGPEQSWSFDSIGRLQQVTSLSNGAYTRFEYSSNKIRIDSYATIQDGLGEMHSFQITDGADRIIATARDHKANIFTGLKTDYDLMGRVVKTSNPTETTASGAPAQWNTTGDDANTGWINTEQTYDWMGRPLVTTHPSLTGNPADTTTRQISYSSCGCAGSEVVTITDEGELIGGALKKRQRKAYSDVLGRVVKTEILNWDGAGPNGTGGTVYSTGVAAYNARDQVTTSTEYAGAEGSATFQVTTMTFDGYGRPSMRHVPEQALGKSTSWTYNDDDTIETITDGRGAVTSYTYNARHLPLSIFHSLSGSNTIGKLFTYDAVGNRKSMSHTVAGVEQDRASYSYDALSRMVSETVHINALGGNFMSGNYPITYAYTLSGQLQSITDPFSSTTGYTYDNVGRLLTATGNYGGVTRNYLVGVNYRAWGDVKSLTFNGGTLSTIEYNARLLPTQFRGSPGRFDYNYHNNGRLAGIRDLDDQVGHPSQVQFHYMSRQYSYDQADRISGVSGFNTGVLPPFSGFYGYDAFGNMTNRGGNYALNQPVNDNATYTNNRRNGWTYDDEGHVKISPDPTTGGTRSWTYDAVGNTTFVSETVPGTNATNTLVYDGDDQLLKDTVVNNSFTTSNYMINSTVLGRLFVKLDASGNKDTTYVPVNHLVTPLEQKDFQGNPTVSWVTHDASGLQENNRAIDPFGNRINNVQPPVVGPPPNIPFYGPGYSNPSNAAFTNANNYAMSCVLDGITAPCDQVMRAVQHGNATPCRDNYCGPRFFTVNGQPAFVVVQNGGGGFWMSDGETSANLFFDDLRVGSLLDGLAAHIREPQGKKPKSGKVTVPEKPEPIVTPTVEPVTDPLTPIPKTWTLTDIIKDAREKTRLKQLFKLAYQDFIDCLNRSQIITEARQEYEQKWMDAYIESWDPEGAILEAGAHAVFDTVVDLKKHKVLRVSMKTVRGVGKMQLFTFIFRALLAGVPQSVNDRLIKEAQDKTRDAKNECLRQTTNKFNVTVGQPY